MLYETEIQKMFVTKIVTTYEEPTILRYESAVWIRIFPVKLYFENNIITGQIKLVQIVQMLAQCLYNLYKLFIQNWPLKEQNI